MTLKSVLATLLAAPVIALAQSPQTYGDWTVSTTSSGVPFMFTANESDALFGKWCDGDKEKCFWMLVVRQTCKDSSEYPALLNSPTGAIHVTLTCAGTTTLRGSLYHRLIVSEFDEMSQVVREGKGRLGFAVPMEDGAFRVSRFSLQGGTAAISRMESLELQYTRTKNRSTRDRVL